MLTYNQKINAEQVTISKYLELKPGFSDLKYVNDAIINTYFCLDE